MKMKTPDAIISGKPIRFRRRMYGGGQWFTWAYLITGRDSFVPLANGEPWPCFTPPKDELERELSRIEPSRRKELCDVCLGVQPDCGHDSMIQRLCSN